MEDIKKVYSIHFPEKQIYVGSTVYSFDEKIKLIKTIKIIYYIPCYKNIQIQKFEKKVLVKKK